MKTKSMIVTLGIVLIGTLQGGAQNLSQKSVPEKASELHETLLKTNSVMKEQSSDYLTLPMAQNAPENEIPTVTLNCELDWDYEATPDLQPEMVIVQSVDWTYYNQAMPMGDTEVSIEIPKDKECYVIGVFKTFYNKSVVVEKLTTDENTHIILDATKADQRITFKPMLENGEKLAVDAITYDDDNNPIIVEKGNVDKAWCKVIVQLNNSYTIAALSNNYLRTAVDDTIVDTMDYIYININDNDCITIYNCVSALSETEGAIAIKLVADGNTTQEVTNSSDDFINIDRRFGDCVWEIPTTNDIYPSLDPSKGCGIAFSTDWTLTGATGDYATWFSGNDKYPTEYFHLNAPSPKGNDYLEMMAQPIKVMFTLFKPTYEQISYGISSPCVMLINDIPYNLASHNFALELNYGFSYWLRKQPGYLATVYNPWFSFPLSHEQKEVFGGNVPITQFTVGNKNQFHYTFVGRYSESRSIDYMNHKVNLYHNGDLIASSWEEIEELPDKWWENPIAPGLFKVEIENANVAVDGIQGCNSFITEYDNSSDDFTFPALEILQFRNHNNEVTDRFESPADGLISFAAGAFKYTIAGREAYFEYDPLKEVTVEYAPNGTNSFIMLNVEEDGDKFYLPGYGAYYYTSLDQVTNLSENGWFDVRITLTDNNGNYQQQTISPAFKIEKNTGIPTLNSSDNILSEVRVNGNNIIAPANAKIISASGIPTTGINLQPGLYIVYLSNGNVKKVVVN